MSDVFEALYNVIETRKKTPQEGSYTCYLFEKGLDKILKKVGEDCAETLIAAKNGVPSATVEELADLVYHLFVLMAAQGIPLSALQDVLAARAQKLGNLKELKQTDRVT